VISSLSEFIKEHEQKIHDLGIDSQSVQRLKRGYGGLTSFDVNSVQSIVDNAILSLLPVLFNSNLIQTFDFGNVSRFSLFMLEKIERDKVYELLLAKMNDIIGHCDISFDDLKSTKRKS
jgi:hypothetical protein